MKRFVAGFALSLATASLAAPIAGNAGTDVKRSVTFRSGSCAGAVSWQQARRVVGRIATIRGPVAGTKYAVASNGSPTFIDVGARYPSPNRFTVVIWSENRARFGRAEARYRGRTICVRGYIDTYAGVPQIEATAPSQIKVVG